LQQDLNCGRGKRREEENEVKARCEGSEGRGRPPAWPALVRTSFLKRSLRKEISFIFSSAKKRKS